MMLILPPHQSKLEPPIIFDRSKVDAELKARYPRELQSAGVGGAVLVHVDINETGAVVQARARSPRLLGLLPRPKPTLSSPKTGEILRGTRWVDHADLLRIAQDAASLTRFVAGARGGVVIPWKRYPLVCYFAADQQYGDRDLDLETGILNTEMMLTNRANG